MADRTKKILVTRKELQQLIDTSVRSILDEYQQIQIPQYKLERSINRLKKRILQIDNQGGLHSEESDVQKTGSNGGEQLLSCFMQGIICQLERLGKIRTSETYTSALSSFMKFRNGQDIPLCEMEDNSIKLYESWLKNNGISPNTISFYMRILRAVYNRAVEKGHVEQTYPFKNVYTGVDRTVKRAVHLEAIRLIKNMDLSSKRVLDFARDMFMFSFYTRGMSFIDMAYLKRKDLRNGTLSYRRHKTGQQMSVKWERCMQEIVDKHGTYYGSPYILPILRYPYNNRNQYKNELFRINKCLKMVANMAGLSIPLTMYVARHSWASIAKSKNIPVSVISQGMGHDSEMTTQIYLASLDTSVVDNANSLILEEL